MRHSSSDHDVREFPPAMAFLAAFTLTLIVGGVAFSYAFGERPDFFSRSPRLPRIPTMEEYREDLRDAAAPFITEASAMTTADVLSADPSLLRRAERARERTLKIVAPGREDVHLAVVLLLDKWIRALKGDAAESVNVVSSTQDFIGKYPWFIDDSLK